MVEEYVTMQIDPAEVDARINEFEQKLEDRRKRISNFDEAKYIAIHDLGNPPPRMMYCGERIHSLEQLMRMYEDGRANHQEAQ